jgi:hypothetical protein
MKGRPTEGSNESLAREIVLEVLGVDVERHDYGTAPGQVDALIHYPDDRVAALEVVADHDPEANKQQAALMRRKGQIKVPGLWGSWIVLLSHQANINDVERALPALLLELQNKPPQWRPPWEIKLSKRDRLRITPPQPMGNGAVSGRVWLEREAWGGWAGDQHTLGEWVTRVLHREADVAAKLAAHPDVAERHAFIWATDTSDMEVQIQLEPGDDHPRPVMPPTLPEGVTHVWVAGRLFSQGALAWFPDRGWWRTPWLARRSGQ